MNVREKLVELLGNIYLPIMARLNTIGKYTMCIDPEFLMKYHS